MAKFPDLVAKMLADTLACQDPTSPESKSRACSQYAPFGAHIPGEGGSYPTTDAAMEALAELADRFRANDTVLTRTVSRDSLRLSASRVAGELLPELAAEPDVTKHWPLFRERLREFAHNLRQDITHYVPVWLFLGQDCPSFAIGPVRFVQREAWLESIAGRRGQQSDWMPGVKALWAGRRLPDGSVWAGLKGAWRAARKSPTEPSEWRRAFMGARRSSRSFEVSNAETVARVVHSDQWVACVDVSRFEREESHRRGVLAARVALDTMRLVIPSPHRRHLSTAADSTVPRSIDRLSQVAGQDLAHGWRFNRPGVSGHPGLAQAIVSQSASLFEAAGRCISAAVSDTPDKVHTCPKLAERWFNAVHWFGRACMADVDFVAVVMLVIALDVLSGGLEERGILELTARLTGTPISAIVLPDGTDLQKLVARTYKLRSEVAHGSILALHETLDIERAQLESLAAAALIEYAIKIDGFTNGSNKSDRDAFLASLPPVSP